MEDLRQSQQWATYLSYLGWQTEKIGSIFAYIKSLGIFGSVIKINRAAILPSAANIKKLQKKYRPLQITNEPGLNFTDFKNLDNLRFKKDKWPLSPAKTIFIDLTKSERQLLNQMHHKTRYNILLAKRKGLSVIISADIASFAQLWLKNMKRKGNYFLLSTNEIEASFKAFGKNAKLVMVHYQKQLLAGVLLILTKNSGHYMFAASNQEGNRLFAPTLAAWKAILAARKTGCKIFDFEGIYDPRFHKATKNWRGFSRFKSSFGGQEVEFPGTYTKYYFPLLKIFSGLF